MNRGFSGPACGLAMLLALGTGAALGQSVVGEPTNAAKTWASNCSMCHRSPQGLAKDERSLSGFLLQHYTTGPQMSAAMAAYLAAAGRGASARDGGPRERGQREATRDAGRDAAREREAREPRPPREVRAAQPEEGAEKGAPKRTEPRKQQAKATPEEPKRRHHDAAPAIELLPAEASKPDTKPAAETVRLADPPKPEASKPEASKPDAPKPESPRQEAAASTTASTPDAQAAPAQAAPAQATPAEAAAAPAPKLPDNQPSFSSALP